MTDNAKIPIGVLETSSLAGTSYLNAAPAGYTASVTDYWASIEVWSRGDLCPDIEHALIAKYRSHTGSRMGAKGEKLEALVEDGRQHIQPATLVIDGEPHDAVELRMTWILARAAYLDDAWIVVVAVPEGAPDPQIRILPGEVTPADGQSRFGNPVG